MARIVPIRRNPRPSETGLRAMSRVPRSTDRWNLAWEKAYRETGDAEQAKVYADSVTKENPHPANMASVKRQWPGLSPQNQNLIYRFARHYDIDEETAHEVLEAGNWNWAVAFDALADLMLNVWGVAEERLPKRNPFSTSFVEGIGTGTGLALAAGVAGPFVVRRLRGALKRVGVRNPATQRFAKFVESLPGTKFSIGDFMLPQQIRLDGRVYKWWYSTHGIRGRSMGMSDELWLSGPGLPFPTKTTAKGSESNADAHFILRNIEKAERAAGRTY